MVQRVVTPVRAPTRSRLLVATPRLEDPNFDRTVVLMIEHDDEGSVGVVLNRPSPLAVSDVLPRWGVRCGEDARVRIGGPVEPEAMLALAAAGPDEAGCRPIGGRLALVDLSVDPAELSESIDPIAVFTGYAGWGPGQLDFELREGAWWVFDSRPTDLSPDTDDLWREVLVRQRSPATLLRDHPDDPALN